jgi:hypothetical protein
MVIKVKKYFKLLKIQNEVNIILQKITATIKAATNFWGEPTNHPGTGSYFFYVPTPPIIIIEIIIMTISY